jgi:DNA-binding response OmpR family regulator
MRANLLLIDGLPESRQASREILERAGYRVTQVHGADEVIHRAPQESFGAVIVDASGGDQVALRHVRALRLHPATMRIPILVLDTEGGDLRGALSGLHSIGWVREPCSPRQLLEELLYLTTPARCRPGFPTTPVREGTAAGASSPEDRPPLGWVDQRTHHHRSGTDPTRGDRH